MRRTTLLEKKNKKNIIQNWQIGKYIWQKYRHVHLLEA
jgi:hypothetical protein